MIRLSPLSYIYWPSGYPLCWSTSSGLLFVFLLGHLSHPYWFTIIVLYISWTQVQNELCILKLLVKKMKWLIYTNRLKNRKLKCLKFTWQIFIRASLVAQLVKKIWDAGNPGLIPGLGRSPGEGTDYLLQHSWASLVGRMAKNQLVKNPPAMREIWVQSLGWEDPLEKGKGTHSSILTWRMPWTV